MRLSMYATLQTHPVTQPLRTRARTRAVIHAPERSARKRERASVDSLAAARAARIIAVRQLMMAIERAELRYEQTAELGKEFDRRLERTKSALRGAGYLSS
jgi:hypothetical protein